MVLAEERFGVQHTAELVSLDCLGLCAVSGLVNHAATRFVGIANISS